jgi:hypothetical protein
MLGQFSAKSTNRRIASVGETFGLWRLPHALARLSDSFENIKVIRLPGPSTSFGRPIFVSVFPTVFDIAAQTVFTFYAESC